MNQYFKLRFRKNNNLVTYYMSWVYDEITWGLHNGSYDSHIVVWESSAQTGRMCISSV